MRMTWKQMNQFAEAFDFIWLKLRYWDGSVEYTSCGLFPGAVHAVETTNCNEFIVSGSLVGKHSINRETYEAFLGFPITETS